jgi:hypothetical protein
MLLVAGFHQDLVGHSDITKPAGTYQPDPVVDDEHTSTNTKTIDILRGRGFKTDYPIPEGRLMSS